MYEDPLSRAGLSATFAKHQDLEVMHGDESDPGHAFSGMTNAESVDVVVADYENGVELASRESRRLGSDQSARIMVVASSDRECEIRHALERGVRGYVLMGCPLEELAQGVRAVHRGARFLSPQVALRLADSLAGEPLTAREEEVLRLVVEGLGNKSIARRMNIAVGTVKSHLKGVFDKLNVDSRTQAICAAERRGLLRDTTSRPGIGAQWPRAASVQRHSDGHHDRSGESPSMAHAWS